MSLSPEQADLHNRLFDEARKLIDGEIYLDGRPLSKPGFFARRRLQKATELLKKVLVLHPLNWSAMFLIGKIEQRFENYDGALSWFLKAREFAPANTSLAKEASFAASKLGDQDLAIKIVDEAITIKADDPGLRINSGLAYLFAGNASKAAERFGEAVALEPIAMNQKLELYAKKVAKGDLPAPRSEKDIQAGI